MQRKCEKLRAKHLKNLKWLFFFYLLNRKHLEQGEQLAAEDEQEWESERMRSARSTHC